MIKNGIGGSNTKTGLKFEGQTDLADFIRKQIGYKIEAKTGYTGNGFDVCYLDNHVGLILKKHGLYVYLEQHGIEWQQILSKKLLPDDSLFVILKNTFYIIECKFQQVEGSVDEKLQTCDFKKKQYQKLLSQINCKVEYIYLLSEWFRKPKYKDVLDYIISVNCSYYFEYLPLTELGLPVPASEST